MAATGGYVKLWRSAQQGWLWSLPLQQFRIAMTILITANWKDGTTWSGGRQVVIRRGQLMTSLPSLAKESRVTVSQVRTALKKLTDAHFITDEIVAGSYRILTVCNYEHYQDASDDASQTVSRPLADLSQTVSTDRRREEGKKGRRKKPPLPPAGDVVEAARIFFEAYNRNFEQSRDPRAWLDDIKAALEAGYTPLQLRAAAWACSVTCSNPEVLKNCTPRTVLRLKHPDGKNCLPQWFEKAEILWREKREPGPKPWAHQLELLSSSNGMDLD